jgi:hypothetical protein
MTKKKKIGIGLQSKSQCYVLKGKCRADGEFTAGSDSPTHSLRRQEEVSNNVIMLFYWLFVGSLQSR